MALYGLCVFLETPVHLRKGRRRYIAASFIITVLAILGPCVDVAKYFPVLLNSTSGRNWLVLMHKSEATWEHKVSTATTGCVLLFGDALLVSVFRPSLR